MAENMPLYIIHLVNGLDVQGKEFIWSFKEHHGKYTLILRWYPIGECVDIVGEDDSESTGEEGAYGFPKSFLDKVESTANQLESATSEGNQSQKHHRPRREDMYRSKSVHGESKPTSPVRGGNVTTVASSTQTGPEYVATTAQTAPECVVSTSQTCQTDIIPEAWSESMLSIVSKYMEKTNFCTTDAALSLGGALTTGNQRWRLPSDIPIATTQANASSLPSTSQGASPMQMPHGNSAETIEHVMYNSDMGVYVAKTCNFMFMYNIKQRLFVLWEDKTNTKMAEHLQDKSLASTYRQLMESETVENVVRDKSHAACIEKINKYWKMVSGVAHIPLVVKEEELGSLAQTKP